MKTMTLVLLAMLKQLTPFHLDTEDAAEREVRLTTLAAGMTKVVEFATCTGDHADDSDCKRTFKGKPEELAVGLYTIGKWESGFAQHIHEDKCRIKIGECDGGDAKSNFQVHATGPVSLVLWRQIGGTDQRSTELAAWAATLMWSNAWRCGSVERAFSAYATSRCDADYPGAPKRAAEYRKFLVDYRAKARTYDDTRK
jgi:hypothetical protein